MQDSTKNKSLQTTQPSAPIPLITAFLLIALLALTSLPLPSSNGVNPSHDLFTPLAFAPCPCPAPEALTPLTSASAGAGAADPPIGTGLSFSGTHPPLSLSDLS